VKSDRLEPKIEGLLLSLAKTKTTTNKSNKLEDKIKRALKDLNGQKKVESKYFDQITSASVTTAGNIINISDITRGSEVTQRVGNQVFLKYIDFSFAYYLNTNTDQAMIRAIILVDTMGVNAPVVSDVLDSGLVGSGYTNIAHYNWDLRKRFIIKKDMTVNLCKNSEVFSRVVKFRVPLNIASYNIGASTTYKNQVYILFIGTESNTLNLSTFQFTSRLVFTDQ